MENHARRDYDTPSLPYRYPGRKAMPYIPKIDFFICLPLVSKYRYVAMNRDCTVCGFMNAPVRNEEDGIWIDSATGDAGELLFYDKWYASVRKVSETARVKNTQGHRLENERLAQRTKERLDSGELVLVKSIFLTREERERRRADLAIRGKTMGNRIPPIRQKKKFDSTHKEKRKK